MTAKSDAQGNSISTDAFELNHALIEQLKTNGSLTSGAVEAAFRAVPRHLFLPEVPLDRAYSDRPIPTKFENGQAISSSSQPAIMAIMLEQLDIQPGHHVLEIGAGTGFNAALMAHLVGETGSVTAVDLDEDIAAGAQLNLAAAGITRVNVVHQDGVFGYAANAPYDRIILTVGGWDISPHWLEQLKVDGRILLPLSIKGPQLSVAFDRQNNHLASTSVRPCGFMRMRGASAEPQSELQLGPVPGLTLESYKLLVTFEPDVIYEWLTGSCQDQSTHIEITPRQIFRSLLLWLSLNEPQMCSLVARDAAVENGLVPLLFGNFSDHKWQAAVAVLTEDGLGVLMRPPGAPLPPPEPGEPPPPFTLFVRSFGPKDDAARRLVEQVQAWDKANRPSIKGLRIRAFPADDALTPVTGEYVVRKRWQQFVLDYPH